ncbi:hypothetical protein NHF46_22975 [Arthrobacter alpinus]|nr:hypothetical protein [Arthrobacter alpinus]
MAGYDDDGRLGHGHSHNDQRVGGEVRHPGSGLGGLTGRRGRFHTMGVAEEDVVAAPHGVNNVDPSVEEIEHLLEHELHRELAHAKLHTVHSAGAFASEGQVHVDGAHPVAMPRDATGTGIAVGERAAAASRFVQGNMTRAYEIGKHWHNRAPL